MPGRGRPKRQARRPTRLSSPDKETPARGHSPAQPRPPKRMRQEEAQEQTWWEPPQRASGSQEPGTPEGLVINLTDPSYMSQDVLTRIKALEAALQAKQASSKGQEIENLSITVPTDVRDKIVTGKFVDFSLLLSKTFGKRPEDEQLCYVPDELGRLVARHERRNKADLTLNQWTSAYHVYMSVYLKAHPEDLQDMLAYCELVRNAARDNPGTAWAQYDQMFRSRKEADPLRPWGMVDSQLWLQLFCKPIEHKGNLAVHATSSVPKKSANPGAMFCFYFNKSRGCQRTACPYKHSCSGCTSQDHGLVNCSQKPGANRFSATTKPPFQFGASHKQ